MAFNQSSMRLDDSPKSRVKELYPKAKCEALRYNGKIEGYVVEVNGRNSFAGSAYEAWRLAEAHLPD